MAEEETWGWLDKKRQDDLMKMAQIREQFMSDVVKTQENGILYEIGERMGVLWEKYENLDKEESLDEIDKNLEDILFYIRVLTRK